MDNRELNIFILNDNADEAGKLRRYLDKRFGKQLHISLFFNRRSCFRMLDSHVDLVVVDDYKNVTGDNVKPGMDALKFIKEHSPSTEVVILSSHENVGTAIDALRTGARDYILNKKGAWQQVLRI